MKLQVTEDQLKRLVGQISQPNEIEEQEETPSTGGQTGYPEVGKWGSGITRGPGNQVGNTKWSEVVGVNLKRGKANPLK
jgi:hypothetical protein